jgi:hypothetical protein
MLDTTQSGNNAARPAWRKRLPSFSPATLLSPGDVQSAVAHESADFRKQLQGSWYLCGDVSDEMYGLLSGQTCQDLALRVSGVRTPVGARYGIISHQLLGCVHRFLLPLYEPRIGDFLLAMRSGRLGFQLGRNGSEKVAALTAKVGVEPELLPLLAMANTLPREVAQAALAELPIVIAEMDQPGRLPSLTSEPVENVSLSVLLPTQTLGRLLGMGAMG